MKLATAEQMKRIDNRAIQGIGIPSPTLMENAAEGLVNTAIQELGSLEGKRIAVFCGSGNNGGDGVCAARHLLEAGADVRVWLVGSREKLSEDTAHMEHLLNQTGGRLEPFTIDAVLYTMSCDLIIDAIFGIGLNSPLRDLPLEAVRCINASPAPVIAADIASGLSADSGLVLGEAVRADVTVTFSMAKPGQYVGAGPDYTGRLIVWDIGIPRDTLTEEAFSCALITQKAVDTYIPKRSRDSHKGDYGRLLLVCGSEGYTGAAVMAAEAALRSGAGLVSLGVPQSIYPIVAGKLLEAMPFPLPDSYGRLSAQALPELLDRLSRSDALLVGPGLGRSEQVSGLVTALLSASTVPIVLDADGINAVSSNINILRSVSAPLILTPHEGEFTRVGGDLTRGRLQGAADFATANGIILILKGPGTIVALPDGRTYINQTGNPGMAVGGSGDVLSGLLVSLLGQGIPPENAAKAAVWLHGLAGDLCAQRIGQYGMLPRDLIQTLPETLKQYS